MFARSVGGIDLLEEFEKQISAGVTAFITFANLAIDEHLVRAAHNGVAIDRVEPVDPADLRRGMRRVRQG